MPAVPSLERRLAGYALAAGAAVAATQATRAAIVYTPLDPDLVFNFDDGGPQSFDLDLNDDATPDFRLLFTTYQGTWPPGPTSAGGSWYYRSVLANGYAGNRVLNSWRRPMAKALNSNYLISSGATSWTWSYGSMAYSGSSAYTTGAAYKWNGGYFLGRNRRMLGLAFSIGADWHYGWCRVSVDKKAKQFTVHDFAYEDTPDAPILSGAYLDPILDGTVGSRVELLAADVPGAPPAFAAMPKVTGHYCDPIKGKKIAKTGFKGVLNDDGSAVILDVKKKVRLYHAKAFKAACKWGITCDEFLDWQPRQGMFFDLEVAFDQPPGPLALVTEKAAHLSLLPPEITGFGGVPNPGQIITVDGNWFGVKPPKVWIEYLVAGKRGDIVKMLKLKVLKPYAFPDAKDKPDASCMNVDDGTSAIEVQLPASWPANFNDVAGEHYLVIDNGIGLATRLLLGP